MSNILNFLQQKRRGVGASCSFVLHFIHPSKLIFDRYTNKEKFDTLGWLVITRRDAIRVTRREQLCIFMKHEDFVHHELHSAQKWVIVVREGSEVHAFKDSEEKEERGEVAVEYDSCDTPIHATTVEDINDLLAYGYKVDNDRLPAPENTPSNTGKMDQPVYTYIWKWNIIDDRRPSVCRGNAEKLDGMN